MLASLKERASAALSSRESKAEARRKSTTLLERMRLCKRDTITSDRYYGRYTVFDFPDLTKEIERMGWAAEDPAVHVRDSSRVIVFTRHVRPPREGRAAAELSHSAAAVPPGGAEKAEPPKAEAKSPPPPGTVVRTWNSSSQQLTVV